MKIDPARHSAVLCGSFRRDPAALQREFTELQEAGCTILSPLTTDFVREVDGFVYGQADWGRSTAEIESSHLRAMERADLVWLHCPGGYVGASAAMELGHANALGIRVFASEYPEDVTLRDLVSVRESPAAAVRALDQELGDAPSDGLVGLQRYYARVAALRGWSDETATLTLEHLRGEVDELEDALNHQTQREAAFELADVQLYLVHLANIMRVDLADAVRAKETINSERFNDPRERLVA